MSVTAQYQFGIVKVRNNLICLWNHCGLMWRTRSLHQFVAGLLCIAAIWTNQAVAADPIFVHGSKPELLQEHGAGEGPAWHPELGLLTSGEGNTNLRDKSGKISVYRKDTGSNGLMFDRQGRLILCEAARRRVTRLESDGTVTVLAAGYEGKPFNQPNDLTMDSKNRIYFSHPQYGDRNKIAIADAAGRKVAGV